MRPNHPLPSRLPSENGSTNGHAGLNGHEQEDNHLTANGESGLNGRLPMPQAHSEAPRLRVDPAHPASPAGIELPRTSYRTGKALLEFVIAVILLVLAAPLILVSALLVKLTSSGPAIYSQVRLGRKGRPFRLHKVRTMFHNCERNGGARWAIPGDPRITSVGRFLRRTHLDELPQLWNVLKGDMSLVGPRPERPEFVPDLQRAFPHYGDRLLVRPGVTGLAQVQLPADTDLASVRRKLAYDLYYIRHQGIWLDLRLMVCTGVHMFGVPFHVLYRLFAMPSRAEVEGAYQAWSSSTGPHFGANGESKRRSES